MLAVFALFERPFGWLLAYDLFHPARQSQLVLEVERRPHSALAYRPPVPEAKLPRSQALDPIHWGGRHWGQEEK